MAYGLLDPEPGAELPPWNPGIMGRQTFPLMAPRPLVIAHQDQRPHTSIWDRIRQGAERMMGIPAQDAGLLSPADTIAARRQGLLSAGAAVAKADPSQSIFGALAQGVSAGRAGALEGIQTQDVLRERAASLDAQRRLLGIQQRYAGKADPQSLTAYARDLYIGGFPEQAYKVAEGIKAMQPEKKDTFEVTGNDGVVRVYDKQNPTAPPVVLGPVGQTRTNPQPETKEIDVASDPGHPHLAVWDAQTGTYRDTGQRAGQNAQGGTKPTPENLNQAELGAAAASAFTKLEELRKDPQVEIKAGEVLTKIAAAIPGLKSADDLVQAVRKANAPEPVQRYLRYMWSLMDNIVRTRIPGGRLSGALFNVYGSEFIPALDQAGNQVIRGNQIQALLSAQGKSGYDVNPDLWKNALRRHGVKNFNLDALVNADNNPPPPPPKTDPLGNRGDVLDQHLVPPKRKG